MIYVYELLCENGPLQPHWRFFFISMVLTPLQPEGAPCNRIYMHDFIIRKDKIRCKAVLRPRYCLASDDEQAILDQLRQNSTLQLANDFFLKHIQHPSKPGQSKDKDKTFPDALLVPSPLVAADTQLDVADTIRSRTEREKYLRYFQAIYAQTSMDPHDAVQIVQLDSLQSLLDILRVDLLQEFLGQEQQLEVSKVSLFSQLSAGSITRETSVGRAISPVYKPSTVYYLTDFEESSVADTKLIEKKGESLTLRQYARRQMGCSEELLSAEQPVVACVADGPSAASQKAISQGEESASISRSNALFLSDVVFCRSALFPTSCHALKETLVETLELVSSCVRHQRDHMLSLQRSIGYSFGNIMLLRQALLHSSSLPAIGSQSNERFEFLGDTLLKFAASHELFHAYQQYTEGQLSGERTSKTNNKYLETIAKAWNLRPCLLCPQNAGLVMAATDARSQMSDCVEAIIAAMYLDCCDLKRITEFVGDKILALDKSSRKRKIGAISQTNIVLDHNKELRVNFLEETIGYEFDNPVLGFIAISPLEVQEEPRPFQRFEFLGDAVLDLITSLKLFRQYPQADEGKLTVMKSLTVRATNLNLVASRTEITDCVFINALADSKQMSDCVEAIIGAIYLDSGLSRNRNGLHGEVDLYEQWLSKTFQDFPPSAVAAQPGQDSEPSDQNNSQQAAVVLEDNSSLSLSQQTQQLQISAPVPPAPALPLVAAPVPAPALAQPIVTQQPRQPAQGPAVPIDLTGSNAKVKSGKVRLLEYLQKQRK